MNARRMTRFLALATLLCLALPAAATLQTIEQAYELTRDQVQLPTDTSGPLRIRPCRDCPPVALQVTVDTQWFTAPGAPAVSRKELLAAFKQAALEPATLVYVYYEPQTKRVKRVVLDRRTEAPRP